MISRPVPMSEAFASIKTPDDFIYMIRDFLDRFRESPDSSLIEIEPAPLRTVLNDEGRADAFLAATAAWLANRNKLRVPDWAKGCSRMLEIPWFAAKSYKLRMLLLQESPSEFRVRNLFVSANALHRV